MCYAHFTDEESKTYRAQVPPMGPLAHHKLQRDLNSGVLGVQRLILHSFPSPFPLPGDAKDCTACSFRTKAWAWDLSWVLPVFARTHMVTQAS